MDGVKHKAILEIEHAKDFIEFEPVAEVSPLHPNDGAKHIVRAIIKWFRSKHVLNWPSQRPNLSQIAF